MNFVEPIRDPKDIQNMKQALANHNEKYLVMFSLGINVGLRISDIITLKVSDVYPDGRFSVREQKTGKARLVTLNPDLISLIADYVNTYNMQPNDWLFPSNQGGHIKRAQAYKMLNQAAGECGIKEAIGTHTLRKTFGYWYYKQYHDIAELQQILNHSSPSVTLRYIGITQDQIDGHMRDFSI